MGTTIPATHTTTHGATVRLAGAGSATVEIVLPRSPVPLTGAQERRRLARMHRFVATLLEADDEELRGAALPYVEDRRDVAVRVEFKDAADARAALPILRSLAESA